MLRLCAPAAFAALVPLAPAVASDDGFEFWLSPSVEVGLDRDTKLELETAQRFRSRSDGRQDTYSTRLWINQDISSRAALSAGVERRVNDPGQEETRFLQQLATRHGILRTRFRLEQRFVEGGRLGLRFRPRLGIAVPTGVDGRLSLAVSAEGFLTLRSMATGGDDGFTGLRTQIGIGYRVSDALSVSLAYLRQQDIGNGPDRVGHAPLIGIDLSL